MDQAEYLGALAREKAGYEAAGRRDRADEVANEIRRARGGRPVDPLPPVDTPPRRGPGRPRKNVAQETDAKRTAVNKPPETTVS